MYYPFFVARRLSVQASKQARTTSRLLRFSVVGIALSLAVMLITLSVGRGFREQVVERVYLLTGHVLLNEYGKNYADESSLLTIPTPLVDQLQQLDGVEHLRKVVQSYGLIKTDSTFAAAVVLGLSSLEAYRSILPPDFWEKWSSTHNPILISQDLARRLSLHKGAKLPLYFMGSRVTVRVFTLVEIVDFPELEAPLVVTSLETMQRIRGLDATQVSRIELFAQPSYPHEQLCAQLIEVLPHSPYLKGIHLGMNTAEELYPDIFAWVKMLDANVQLLLVLLMLVVVFTLTTGLLVLILDRTPMIGLLKALGAHFVGIRSVFLYLASFVIVRGLLWGNGLALLLLLLQKYFHWVTLDPQTYYVSYVPVSFSVLTWVGVNLLVFVLTMLVILLPSRLIGRIKPVDTLRFH